MVTFSELGRYGRMGNQMFQIAAVACHAWRNGAPWAVPKWEYAHAFVGPFPCYIGRQPTSPYQEPRYYYDPLPAPSPGSVLDLRGYFQSLRYWDGYEDRARALFAFTPLALALAPARPHGVSMLVRRDDYVGSASHRLLDDAYYGEAIRIVDRAAPGAPYFIYGDEDEVSRDLVARLLGDRATWAAERRAVGDLVGMAQCGHVITGNSTFGWWAGMLCRAPGKQVVMPVQWMQDHVGFDQRELVVPGWHTL
jgi:hypothetical protein